MSHNYEVLKEKVKNIVTEYFTSLNRLRDLKSNGTPKTPVNIKRDRSSIDDILKIQLGKLGYDGNTFVTNYNLSIAEHNKVDSNFQMGERMKHTIIANDYLTSAASAIGLTLQDIRDVKSTQPPARNFGGPKQIFVKSSNNMTFTINITPDETVESLKTQIFNQEGISIDLQKLLFAGELLENDRSLESYNILPLTTIHLVIGEYRNAGEITNERTRNAGQITNERTHNAG